MASEKQREETRGPYIQYKQARIENIGVLSLFSFWLKRFCRAATAASVWRWLYRSM